MCLPIVSPDPPGRPALARARRCYLRPWSRPAAGPCFLLLGPLRLIDTLTGLFAPFAPGQPLQVCLRHAGGATDLISSNHTCNQGQIE